MVKPGAAVRIDREWATFWNFIKFRSGTRDHPVVQRERREFAITLSTAAAAPPAARSADAQGPGSAIGVSCPGAAGAPGIEGTISNKRR